MSVPRVNQKVWQTQCAMPLTGTYHPPFLQLEGEQQCALLHSGWTKKALLPVGLCHTDVSFPLGAHTLPKGPRVSIWNRSVKQINKTKNYEGKEMTLEGGRRERSQRDGIYWAWFTVLEGSFLPEPDESDSLSVCAGTTVILVSLWGEWACTWEALLSTSERLLELQFCAKGLL